MIVVLVIWAGLAVIGFKHAEKYRQKYGRAPWGTSPGVWAAACFLLGILGIILLAVASRAPQAPVRPQSVWAAAPYDPRYAQLPPTPYGVLPAPPAYPAPPGHAPPPGYAPPIAPPAYAPPAAPVPAPPPRTPGGPNVGGTDFLPRR